MTRTSCLGTVKSFLIFFRHFVELPAKKN